MERVRIEGIDEPLPEGETLLWQGRPEAWALARHTFKIRWIGAYFVALAAVAAAVAGPEVAIAARVAWLLLLGALVGGLVWGYAVLTARSAVYAFSDARVVMRVGVAFPAVFNLPFSRIGGAEARTFRDGTGEVAFDVVGSERIGLVYLWPHTRPWRWRRPQPMFRGLPDAEAVAERLRDALVDAGVGTELPDDTAPVEYSVLDDDGIVILSNRAPATSRDAP